MDSTKEALTCEYCGAKMKKWMFPPNTGWDGQFHYVCFNNECGYFIRGWDWMLENYKVKSSYRNRVNPNDGRAMPLPVWSEDAMKNQIVE